jgi:DNA-binding CsgD family transcriptional regulator/tetratricopeptide (TPR) repeat protein
VGLLERDAALEQLHKLLEDAVNGRGRLVLIAGEAGIGKTRLVQHFGRAARERVEVLVGACDPLSTPTPLGPLLDIAPALGGELVQLLHDGAPVQRVFGALREQLSSAARPRVLVIEDVHWADQSTLDMLRFLARRVGDTHALLLATYRDDEVGAHHPLRVALGDIASSGVVRLSVAALSLNAVGILAAGRNVDVAALHRRTAGNPFFVKEILAAQTTHVPVNVRDALLARVARLSPAGRAVLEAAALSGPRVDVWLIERIAGGGEHAAADSLDACVEAGLLVTEQRHFVFRHELLREAVVELTPAHRQIALHRSILAALVEAGAHDDLLAGLAHHAEAASDAAAVLMYAPAAARRAAQLGAHREAAAQYARALRWADRLDPRERALLLEGRGVECWIADQAAEAIDARRAAVDIWRELGDHEREGDNLRSLSRVYWIAGQNAQAEVASQQALDVLEQCPPGLPLAWALWNAAQLRYHGADHQAALTMAARAVELGQAFGALDVVLHARLTHAESFGQLHDQPFGPALQAEIESVLRIALESGAVEIAGRALTMLAIKGAIADESDRAEQSMQRALAFVEEHDLQFYRHFLLGVDSVRRLQRGDWAEALRIAQTIVGGTDHSVVNRMQALRVIGQVHARRGEPVAWGWLDQALQLADTTGELQHIRLVRSARAEAAWLAGDFARAAAEARPAFELGLEKGDTRLLAEPTLWLCRAGALPRPYPRVTSLPIERELAGDWASAARKWAELGRPFERACALAESHDVAALRQALQIAEQLGALPLAALVVERLRFAGARPASPRPSRPEPTDDTGPVALAAFSPREREVIVLIAEGCTNREIAERLVISERTAEKHVQNVLSRLGVRSRTQVAAWAVRNGSG